MEQMGNKIRCFKLQHPYILYCSCIKLTDQKEKTKPRKYPLPDCSSAPQKQLMSKDYGDRQEKQEEGDSTREKDVWLPYME
jgi:hypothetical protein